MKKLRLRCKLGLHKWHYSNYVKKYKNHMNRLCLFCGKKQNYGRVISFPNGKKVIDWVWC